MWGEGGVLVLRTRIRGRVLGAAPPSLRSYGPLRARSRACLACGSGPAQYRALVNGVPENRAGGGPARAEAQSKTQLAEGHLHARPQGPAGAQ